MKIRKLCKQLCENIMVKILSHKVINDNEARELLDTVILGAREAIGVVVEAYKQPWSENPSTGVRAVFGYWLSKAVRHLVAITILCEERDLSVVANVHHRQIFEIYLQARYFTSFPWDEKEYLAEKISALGCIEYLEKLEVIKNHDSVQSGYNEMLKRLSLYDENIINEIKMEREKRSFYWFGTSFSKLAKNVSKEGEDLRRVYQIISADIHGAWGLALDVSNPEPGVLDFRGYPDKATMFRRAADLLDQATTLYMNLWNEVAVAVGAPEVNV